MAASTSKFTLPEVPSLPETDPSRCVFDAYRTRIAQLLSEALPISLEQAYDGVDYGKKGEDFTVALPRYRLPGNPNEIGAKVIEKVCALSCEREIERHGGVGDRTVWGMMARALCVRSTLDAQA